jgi:hypothetical protein
MLVGWGGNNGSTLTGGVIANRESVFLILDLFVFFFLIVINWKFYG